jgi:Tol biopolymer transport system component
MPPEGGVATIKALGSDGTTYATATVSVTQSIVPVLVAYINTGASNTTCGGGVRAECSVINLFDLSTPTNVIQVEPYSVSQDLWPAISFDQSTIAYVAYHPTGWQSAIFTVPTKGGTPTLINGWGASYTVFNIDWKPDGSGLVIAYADSSTGIAGLATMLKNGTNIVPITVTNQPCTGGSCSGVPYNPRYLADGRIVYSATGPQGNVQMFVLSADGGTKTNISNNGAQEGVAAPSPDSTKVVYQTNRDGIIDVYTENIDGTNARALVSTPSGYPSWCPGNKIVFVDLTAAGPNNLHSINSDGTGAAQLTTSGNTNMPYCR